MDIEQILELYELISEGNSSLQNRKEGLFLRESCLNQAKNNPLIKIAFDKNSFDKTAFDTRRVNQETDYNPRRGLQNYHRSEQFISEGTLIKVESFKRIKVILDDLKKKYGREPEWQDSYCRVLLNTLDKTLRVDQGDYDFGENQPAIGSFDYVEELLFTRYRLSLDNINKYADEELKDLFLNKDESLIRKTALTPFYEKKMMKTSPPPPSPEITKRDVVVQSYDALVEKLFGVYATRENPDIERTITITIKDKINQEEE